MISYDQDPDVVRWGLQLFDGDPFSNCGYCGMVMQNHVDCYLDQYNKDGCFDLESTNAENSFFTFTLQDELSRLTVNEVTDSPNEGDGNVQPSFCQQDWLDQSMENFTNGIGRDSEWCQGIDNGHEEAQNLGTCSIPDRNLNYGDQWTYSQEPMDGYELDGEIGKRLTQMVSIPHVPKINGEIPSFDEATLDHQRLLDRLQLYDLVECKVLGDGNCQFRALSDQIYRTSEHHEFVRQQIVDQIQSCPEIYEGYVPMDFPDYINKMSKTGEWGDHVTLQAAADTYGVKIFVITSFKDTCYIEILPHDQRSQRVIFLSFWSEVHYNSIYPEGDVPTTVSRKKKVQWEAEDNFLETTDE
ncbi:OVARIAN TUMOR DOMAIN-containing deubiquitinating enzyme 12-like [Impatiens glandulifera]|uniref:OVARIAN TUMOR DOMAIN-containing deubiquitinating enzyme 12-like n=1 Tax=Impatiens glandulifera TaxID=253017 RepID=UPI001FB14846|nr:OVARIAN TUMOR DOMAIN-containing deubiquitinating enzyme 12-like [Impatiens glandulifera]XP_047310072.1 OVARIAN TUMOR DOMAIN-containing deubiquitinating enzyme 12-like [Impatiens glandulifera]